jgi:hypothetical protein
MSRRALGELDGMIGRVMRREAATHDESVRAVVA